MSIFNYQLSDFRAEVQLRIGEPAGGGLWSVSELNNYINRALLRVAMDVRIPKKDTQIPVVQYVSFYSLPPDYLIPEFIYASSQNGFHRLFPMRLFQMDKINMGRSTWEKDSPGFPANFVTYGHNGAFILWPAPSNPPEAGPAYGEGLYGIGPYGGSTVNDNVNLHYVPLPTPLVLDTDTTPFPLAVQRLIPLFASYLAMLKTDVKKASLHLGEYKKRVILAREQQRNNEQLRPKIMAPGSQGFDRKQSNPEVIRDWTRWGWR